MRITLDDTSPILQYVSVDTNHTWIQDSTSHTDDKAIKKYCGETMMKTTGIGNYMTLDFHGTGISVYGAKRGNHGTYSVTLDENDPELQSGFVADPGEFQALLYEAKKLDGGREHHLKISNDPSDTSKVQYLDIDYIVINVDMNQKKVYNTMIDDTSPFCHYSGDGWVDESPMRPEMYYNTTAHISKAQNDTVTCSFNGTSIQVLGGLVGDHGNYSVSIDGQPATVYNGSYPTFQAQATLFLATNLTDGPHDITMTNTDVGKWFDLDYMLVNSTTDPNPSPVELAGTSVIDPIETGNAASGLVSPDKKDDNGNGILIGSIVGSILGIVILTLLGLALWRRSRRSPPKSDSNIGEKYISDSARPFQVDSSSAQISPFTGGIYTYQDSPFDQYGDYDPFRDQKRSSPLVTGPPQSAFAFHPYLSGIPRSPASATNTLLLGQSSGSIRHGQKSRHPRQTSISEITNSAASRVSGEAYTAMGSEVGSSGSHTLHSATVGAGSKRSPGSAGTASSGWSPRPRGAKFSLPPLALPPKMFVLGQDGEVEPLGSPGASGRSSVVTRRSGMA